MNTTVEPRDLWVLRNPGIATSGASCLRLCQWQVSSSPLCDARTWNITKVITSNQVLWDSTTAAASASQATPPLLGNADCSSVWQSPFCTDPAQPAHGDWLAFQFDSPQAVRCMQLVQPTTRGSANFAMQLETYSCAARDLGFVNSSGAFVNAKSSWDPLKKCTRMTDVFPDGNQSRLLLKTDPSCAATVPLEAAQRAKDGGDDPVNSISVYCFCTQQVKKLGASFRLPPYNTPEQKVCEQWNDNENQTTGFIVLGVIMVLILNQLLLVVFTYIDTFARYPTRTDLANNQLVNLFLSQLFGTGLINIFVGMNLHRPSTGDDVWNKLRFGAGLQDDTNLSWFPTVGATLVVTIASQVLTAIVFPIIWAKLVVPATVWYSRRSVVTQNALNTIYEYPDWTLSVRLAESLVIFFCCIMYAGGMPVLYYIGMIYCFCAYWVDKWTLLRESKRPPAYNVGAVSYALVLLPFAGLLHLFMTMWFFGNQNVFPSSWTRSRDDVAKFVGIDFDQYGLVVETFQKSGSDVQQAMFSQYVKARCLDVTRQAVWPLMFIFFAFMTYYGLALLWAPLKPTLRAILGHFKDGLKEYVPCLKEKTAEETKENYEQAKAKLEQWDVLFSYKLSDNPRYKEAYEALLYDPDEEEKREAANHKRHKSPIGQALGQVTRRLSRAMDRIFFMADNLGNQMEKQMTMAEETFLDRTEGISKKTHGTEYRSEADEERPAVTEVHESAPAALQSHDFTVEWVEDTQEPEHFVPFGSLQPCIPNFAEPKIGADPCPGCPQMCAAGPGSVSPR